MSEYVINDRATAEQMRFAEAVIRNTVTGPKYPGWSASDAVKEWLLDQARITDAEDAAKAEQDALKGAVAKASARGFQAAPQGLTFGGAIELAVTKALSNYELKRV